MRYLLVDLVGAGGWVGGFGVEQLGHRFFGEVAPVVDLPFVVGGEDGAGEAEQGGGVGEHADDVDAAFDLSVDPFESLNARYRRVVRARGHFPTERAALKCLYLVTRSLDPTGRGRARWIARWKPVLNAFAITFEGRLTPSTTN